ncbi:hypothetical protein FB107DRAFT_214207 [Schizophyllum commune]
MRRSARIAARINGMQIKGSTEVALTSCPSGHNQQSGGDATKRPARKRRQRQGSSDNPQTGPTAQRPVAARSAPATPGYGEREPSSPMNRLPVELLAEIFLIVHAFIITDQAPFHDPSRELDKTITRVCKAWRHVAYNTPFLWTFFGAQNSEVLDSCLERYLPLTKGCRLDLLFGVYIDIDSDELLPEGTTSDDLLVCVEKLRPYASKLRALRLFACGRELGQIESMTAPNLKEVTVWTNGGDDIDNHSSLEFVTGAPRLRRLCFYTWIPLSGSTLRLPSAPRLTALSLEFEFFDILCMKPTLQQCSETLEELDLTVNYFDHADLEVEPVAFPALKRLSLHFKPCDALLYINSPILEEMIFDCPADDANSALQKFLVRVPSAVEHLRRLKMPSQDPTTVDDFLQCMSLPTHLEKLSLGSTSGKTVDKVLASLTCRDDTPPLLPKLTSIDIFTPMHEEKDPLLYDNFKKSRALVDRYTELRCLHCAVLEGTVG